MGSRDVVNSDDNISCSGLKVNFFLLVHLFFLLLTNFYILAIYDDTNTSTTTTMTLPSQQCHITTSSAPTAMQTNHRAAQTGFSVIGSSWWSWKAAMTRTENGFKRCMTLMCFVRSMHEQTKKTTNNATKGLYMYGS